VAAEYKSAPLS